MQTHAIKMSFVVYRKAELKQKGIDFLGRNTGEGGVIANEDSTSVEGPIHESVTLKL